MTTTVGLRELREDASEILRRVEAGEDVMIAVDGRPSARLVPVGQPTWRGDDEVADVVAGSEDPDWESDRDLIDQRPRDPWEST